MSIAGNGWQWTAHDENNLLSNFISVRANKVREWKNLSELKINKHVKEAK